MDPRPRIIVALVAGLVCYGHPHAQQPSGNVSAAERQTLIEFFAATGGTRWTNHAGWGTSTPVCSRYGVFCDFVDGDANRPFVAGLSVFANPHQSFRWPRDAHQANPTPIIRLSTTGIMRNQPHAIRSLITLT